MADPFRIPITIDDHTDKGAATIFRRMEELAAKLGGINTRADKLGKNEGLPQFGQQLRSVGFYAEKLAAGLGGANKAMGLLTGAGSVGGLAALTSHAALYSRALTMTSARTGVSVKNLQEFEGAAKLAGSSGEAMRQSMANLGQTMEDALYGRNRTAQAVFAADHLAIRRTVDGSMDAANMMTQVAGVMHRLHSAQGKATLASVLGISPDLIPMLSQGSAALGDLRKQTRSLGYVMSQDEIDRGNKFAKALGRIDVSVEGLAKHIGSDLLPAAKALSGWTTGAITDFERFDKAFSGLGGQLVGYGAGAAGLASAGSLARRLLGRGATVIEGDAAAASRSLLGGAAGLVGRLAALAYFGLKTWWGGGLNKGEDAWLKANRNRGPGVDWAITQTMPQVVDYFQKQGWTRAQATGIAANLYQESHFDAAAPGDNGQAYGVAQWHPDRQARFAAWAGYDIRNSKLDKQLAYIQYGLTKGAESQAGAQLALAPDARTAAEVFSRLYERPAGGATEAAARGAIADRFSSVLSAGAGKAGDTTAPVPAGQGGAPGVPAGQNGRLDIHIHAAGGIQVTAETSPEASYVQPIIHYAMPTSRFP